MAAVAYSGKPRTPDVVVDETWFSDPEFCKQSKVCMHDVVFPGLIRSDICDVSFCYIAWRFNDRYKQVFTQWEISYINALA